MKQVALFWFVFLFQTSAHAMAEFKWDLTPPAANTFVKAMYKADASDAVCTASGIRPTGLEDRIAAKDQKVECHWNNGKESAVTPFIGNEIDSWGQRRDLKSFRVYGPTAEKMFDLFQKQTKGLNCPEPAGSMWSRLYLCDYTGGACTQPVILSADGSADSAAQMDCARETTLIKASTVAIDSTQYDANHYPDYLDDMINAQIKAGERTIDKIYCTFIAP